MAQRLKQRLELLENSSAAKEKITVVRIIVDTESKSLIPTEINYIEHLPKATNWLLFDC